MLLILFLLSGIFQPNSAIKKIALEENFKPSIFLCVILQDSARTLTSQPGSLLRYTVPV
jgi:hypothetical protein